MCRPQDFPPYDDSPEMPAPGYDAQTRPIPSLYDGPRCDRCGGDHFPGREPITEEDEPMTEQHIERMATVFVLFVIVAALLAVANLIQLPDLTTLLGL